MRSAIFALPVSTPISTWWQPAFFIAAAMKKAGCHQVLMGVETGSAKIAERIGKPIDHERYFEAIRIAHRNGIETRCSFIIGNMDETQETMMETLNFAMEIDTDLFQLS